MKIIKNLAVRILLISIISVSVFSSCNDDFLEEVPKGFLSPENTYTDLAGFESAINECYAMSRNLGLTFRDDDFTWLSGIVDEESDKSYMTIYGQGTDLGWYWNKVDYFGDYSLINSFNDITHNYWVILFKLVRDANVIITRSESEIVTWESEADKISIQAQARWFRAFAYRFLVHLYGDVPIIAEEITGPKVDFVRSPRSEVYDFVIADLEFASQYLPAENNRDGRITKAAADQLLAEIYISTGEYDKSIEASSRIIDDPQYELMTERFGSLQDKPGDVFWDLFRLGNQSTPDNTEVIWTWQVEYNVPGGMVDHRIQRCWGPNLGLLKTPDGMTAIIADEFRGRPIAFIRPSVYLEYTIWQSDWDNDIRNSEYNMQRTFYINNPESAHFGEEIIPRDIDTVRSYFVYIKKASHPYGAPQGYDRLGKIYSDIYVMRLAETYLLRAEAYIHKGDKVSAAADINVVRNRANATPVDPADVDIDYLLDERARELVVEEPRRLTLARLGLLDDRVKKYNPVSAPTIQEYHNLWPIPQREIDANVGAELTQNPGYE